MPWCLSRAWSLKYWISQIEENMTFLARRCHTGSFFQHWITACVVWLVRTLYIHLFNVGKNLMIRELIICTWLTGWPLYGWCDSQFDGQKQMIRNVLKMSESNMAAAMTPPSALLSSCCMWNATVHCVPHDYEQFQ